MKPKGYVMLSTTYITKESTKKFDLSWVISYDKYQGRRKGGTLGALAPPIFDRTVNPISTRGADYAHHNTTSPLNFSDLATALTYVFYLYLNYKTANILVFVKKKLELFVDIWWTRLISKMSYFIYKEMRPVHLYNFFLESCSNFQNSQKRRNLSKLQRETEMFSKVVEIFIRHYKYFRTIFFFQKKVKP